MTKKRLIMLGDSITNGFDGFKDLTNNLSYYLQQLLPNWKIENCGVNAGAIIGNTERDLTFQIESHDFTDYQLATVFFGTNDFAHSDATLTTVAAGLQHNLTRMQKASPQLKIVGILPLPRFDGEMDNQNIEGMGQYTLAELDQRLKSVYQSMDIPVLDWQKVAPNLITINNYRTTLGDQRLHPNAATYRKMAEVLFHFLHNHHLT
ncbi:SGNH/GDSL hydrolase family protein [Fructilactobacillus cliffordii]|uniref:SGNH/GDSL hydrolase family protein n=1 Tax=Fructilactobacillus cliffordii TaxID=2940299 RepID=A0A9Q8ZT20_9LACO|nr:SGNH/GDSL hydrolase family protein [Fructilactobacillus cliffordii]USS87096.1 SGNH/GDSL hydrolase family protein [Fructilactobacillus cliffordii]USS88818.1 SGNH/GDSL hydrolase family protein [Fructilactobacillus cliffordii]